MYASNELDSRNVFRGWYKELPSSIQDSIMLVVGAGAPPLVVEYYVRAFRSAVRLSLGGEITRLGASCSEMATCYLRIHGLGGVEDAEQSVLSSAS
jgi:hypothetical protein